LGFGDGVGVRVGFVAGVNIVVVDDGVGRGLGPLVMELGKLLATE
jgi:hypothetical protein